MTLMRVRFSSLFMVCQRASSLPGLVSLFCLGLGLSAQTLNYQVELLGLHTGDMVLKKFIDGQGVQRYSMNTSADVNYLFGRTTASFDSDIRYKNGRIFFAQAKNVRDGKRGRFSVLRCSASNCEVETDRGKASLRAAPTWCIARLFFEEPVHQTEVYSEDWGQVLRLKQTGVGRYQVYIPGDKPNEYRYEAGKMVELITHTSIGKARVLLQK